MTHRARLLVVCLLALFLVPSRLVAAQNAPDTYVYADFDEVKDGRPVSKNGGRIQLTAYAEIPTNLAKMTGAAGLTPPAPELVRTDPNNPNRAATFEYDLPVPNQYAGVTLEIRGREESSGRPVADDLSAYKTISLQVFSDGINAMRIEIVSTGQGLTNGSDSDTVSGFPQKTFKLNPGFNTYKVAIDSLKQPGWQQAFRVGAKDVVKKLTAVHLAVFCENGCRPTKGRVVVDNLVFEK
jgi:hypothetical protein